MDDDVEIMVDLYDQLRAEILQSIELQNKVVLGEAIVIGLVYGVELSGNLSRLLGAAPRLRLLIAIVPPIIIVATSIWIVEQTRMMRAGDYLEFLEDKINREMGGPYLSWENWLRRERTAALGLNRIHHYAQYVGYLGLFYLFGFLALWIYFQEVLGGRMTLGSPEGIYYAINIIGLIALVPLGFPIISHRGKRADKADFAEWERDYRARIDIANETNGGEGE